MKDALGRPARSCPVCGVQHLIHWDDYFDLQDWDERHAIAADLALCEDCVYWADGNIPDELRGMSFQVSNGKENNR